MNILEADCQKGFLENRKGRLIRFEDRAMREIQGSSAAGRFEEIVDLDPLASEFRGGLGRNPELLQRLAKDPDCLLRRAEKRSIVGGSFQGDGFRQPPVRHVIHDTGLARKGQSNGGNRHDEGEASDIRFTQEHLRRASSRDTWSAVRNGRPSHARSDPSSSRLRNGLPIGRSVMLAEGGVVPCFFYRRSRDRS